MADRFKQFKQYAAGLTAAEQIRRSVSSNGPTPLALVYPNHYAVGMASLGFQTVYRLFNETPIFACERAFLYEGSFASLTYTIESQRSLRSFPIIAFSLAYELDYLNMLHLLRLAGIPLAASSRNELDPLILCGGVTLFYNPEVVAPTADVIFLGEAEPLIPVFSRHYQEATSRAALLAALAQESGFYIPALHHNQPLTVQHLAVNRQEPAASFCIPQQSALKMFMIEVGRGCGRGCRFCTAGHVYHPFRVWPLPQIMETVEKYAWPGDRIGLVGAALSDYQELDLLCTRLLAKGYGISLSSLRLDRISDALLQALAASGIDSITLAPEAGSERMRRIIAKNLSEEQILAAVSRLSQSSIKTVKLYYMIGLPFEMDADIRAIVALTERIAALLTGKNIRVGLSAFIPKPATPFQWAGMAKGKELKAKYRYVSQALKAIPRVSVSSMNLGEDVLQAWLSLGDQALGRRLLQEEKWLPTDHTWIQSEKTWDTPLPWDYLDCGISRERLWGRWQQAREAGG